MGADNNTGMRVMPSRGRGGGFAGGFGGRGGYGGYQGGPYGGGGAPYGGGYQGVSWDSCPASVVWGGFVRSILTVCLACCCRLGSQRLSR